MTWPVQSRVLGGRAGLVGWSRGRKLVTMRVTTLTAWEFDDMDALSDQVTAVLERFGFKYDQIEVSHFWDTEFRTCTGEMILLEIQAYFRVSPAVVRAVLRTIRETDPSLRVLVGTLEPDRVR